MVDKKNASMCAGSLYCYASWQPTLINPIVTEVSVNFFCSIYR